MAIVMAPDLEEDPTDGMNIKNCDYMIMNFVKDHEQDRERPLTSSVSAESQSISLKQQMNYSKHCLKGAISMEPYLQHMYWLIFTLYQHSLIAHS